MSSFSRIGLYQGLCGGLLLSGISLKATPDLVVNQTRLEANVAVQTRTFASSDCSVVEGCTVAGSRRLLLFDVGIANIGTGDLFIGNPADYPNLFHFSSCHGHYHFDGTAAYELLTPNGDTVVTARKQGFCFRDDALFVPGAGPAKYTCENQGISIGWEDVYDKSLDCQWLDITGVPCGEYILRVVANPDAILPELNYTNNVAEVLITLECSTNTPPPPPPGGTNMPPTTCTNKPPTTCTNKPPKCVHHEDWSKCWDWKKLSKMCNGHYQKNCKIPHCPCKCHIPPNKPCKGNKDDHGGKGQGKGGGDGKGDGKDCDKGNGHGDNGGGKGGNDDKDHGGKGNGKDCDKDNDHKGGGGKGEGKGGGNDDHGKGKGKDCDDDKGGKGGKGGGKDNDNNHGKGGKGGKDDGKGKGGGKGNDKGKGGGKGKDDANCKPGGGDKK
ncbi:MAG TPA: lysyl oxidase family protein [Verrucomicrobiae bacterium]|nr:lysyl oxidase family protein [Verrucomicrobiae bacterium]